MVWSPIKRNTYTAPVSRVTGLFAHGQLSVGNCPWAIVRGRIVPRRIVLPPYDLRNKVPSLSEVSKMMNLMNFIRWIRLRFPY